MSTNRQTQEYISSQQSLVFRAEVTLFEVECI